MGNPFLVIHEWKPTFGVQPWGGFLLSLVVMINVC